MYPNENWVYTKIKKVCTQMKTGYPKLKSVYTQMKTGYPKLKSVYTQIKKVCTQNLTDVGVRNFDTNLPPYMSGLSYLACLGCSYLACLMSDSFSYIRHCFKTPRKDECFTMYTPQITGSFVITGYLSLYLSLLSQDTTTF